MKKIKLNSTAAFNLHYSTRSLDGDLLGSFKNFVDQTQVVELSQKFNSICPFYDEVIENRKCYLQKCLSHQLSLSDEEHLIIILAAGKSPLSLQILFDHYDKVHKILEIDSISLEDKKELYDLHFPRFSDKIKCITADITSKSILCTINSIIKEYYEKQPCIILLEGVSFYFSIEDIENIINSFKSIKQKNTLLMDYLLPSDKLSDERKLLIQKVNKTVQEYVGKKELTSLTSSQLENIINSKGGSLLKVASLKDMEKERTGTNKYFNKNNDGWLECSIWQI